MKKILLSIIYFLVCTLYIKAQVLYGTTFSGGTYGGGTISKFMPATNNLTVVKSFENLFRFRPKYTNFIEAGNGKLYGMTTDGGSSGNGVIFSFDPTTSAYTNEMDFDVANGADPEGSLMLANDGKLYGMTYGGGSIGYGVIFSFDPSNSTFAKLKDFNGTDGGPAYGSLMQASDGKIYGMTAYGGSLFYGVIFSFDPSSSTYTKLMDFDITNGANPYGSLIQANDGKLYGMTSAGGSFGYGVVFSFDPSSSTYTKLKDFDKTSGAYPYGSLMQANDRRLYGMTKQGGNVPFPDNIGDGVIFSIDPSTSVFTKLSDFDGYSGSFPYGDLIQAGDGKLYGITSIGGSSGGVIFSFDLSSSTYKKAYNFDAVDGQPFGSLLQATDGKLYGMTSGGADFYSGVIFSFDPSTSNYSRLKDFVINESGTNVSASLLRASDGKLYGITNSGGSLGYGVIFSFDPSSSTYTKLMDFDITNGANPYGSLIQANDGKLYGMTVYGGLGVGVIFSFDPSTSTFTDLHNFGEGSRFSGDGWHPYGSLIQASDGKLYGMALTGYGPIDGIMFSYDPSTAIYTKLGLGGAIPYGGFIQASDGKLYAMTNEGGISNAGVIFSFDPSTSISTALFDFDNTNGANPSGDLVQAKDGKLYGMTGWGGINNVGVIFRFDPSSSSFTKLKDFDTTDGANPYGNLMQAGDGKLYGMTRYGGSFNDGVIFSYDPITSTFTKLQDYNGANGANPYLGSGFIEVPEGGPLPLSLLNFTGKHNLNTNEVTWKTANEQSLDYFELQRSSDGKNFSGIYRTHATGKVSYSYDDKLIASSSSVYFYRLKSVNDNGNFSYSEILRLTSRFTANAVTVTPNPFKEKIIVAVESSTPDKVTFVLTDASGRQILKQNRQLFAGTNVLSINEAAVLTPGTYLLTIVGTEQTQTIKVIKIN